MQSAVRELPELLTWRRSSTAAPRLCEQYERTLRQCLTSIATTSEEATAIVETLALLADRDQGAFLRAPLVASRLLGARDGDRFDAGPIVKSLMAELTLAEIDCGLSEAAWTVLGDRRVEVGGKAGCAAATRIPGTSIVVDKAGPIDFSVASLRPLLHPTEHESSTSVRKLDDAAQIVEQSSRAALAFWQNCVDVVALRTFAQPDVGVVSAALRYNARVTLLVNAHAPDADIAGLGDLLLHEAIHSFLFMAEETSQHFVPDRARREEIKIVSPWTGHALKLSAFVHACFVWYGIYWFWKSALEKGAARESRASELLQAARIGFDSQSLSALLTDHIKCLSSDVVPALQAVEDRMRAER